MQNRRHVQAKSRLANVDSWLWLCKSTGHLLSYLYKWNFAPL